MHNLSPEEKAIGRENFQAAVGSEFTRRDFLKGALAATAVTAGGVGAMSHPGTTRRDDLITDFIAEGMRAMEVYHPKHSEGDIARYKRLAEKLGLVVTGGSDSHGRRNPKLHIGAYTVPRSTVEALKKARSY